MVTQKFINPENKKQSVEIEECKLDKKLDSQNYLINDVIEKPLIKDAPSNKAVIGRYILPKEIFSKLIQQKPGKGLSLIHI